MKVLVVGGSGHVGNLTLPYLKNLHELRVFDLKPPADEALEYFAGDVADLDALSSAMQGVDALVYMAMGTMGQRTPEKRAAYVASAFDVNVKGLYHALYAAHTARIAHAVFASSLSVYRASRGRSSLDARYYAREEMVPDAVDCYGLTKRLGEEICQAATVQWGLSVNALRLCRPVTPEQYAQYSRTDRATILTSAPDVASALDAALRYRPDGFESFFIAGDYNQELVCLEKAKRLLGWEPLARPTRSSDDFSFA